MLHPELEIPGHFDPTKVGEVWRVEYQEMSNAAANWGKEKQITPAYKDEFKICLILVDVQNTFCIPGFELYVGGRSGTGAVDDNARLCRFIYRNIPNITQIVPTMDTHHLVQVFHSIFLVNEEGKHPDPLTTITEEDVKQGHWRINPEICPLLNISPEYGQRYLEHYTKELRQSGKYSLTIWPYHAMLGGIGHALVSAVEEAICFHSFARSTQPDFHVKGENPFTEHYSVLGPEVTKGIDNQKIGHRSERIFKKLTEFNAVIITGQAKSHCVVWTIADLLEKVLGHDRTLVERVYLLEDCTSPVVVPGVVDYTEEAEQAFRRFDEAGMNVVKSTDPISSWPGMG